jgi:class 3 adenylate cyclase
MSSTATEMVAVLMTDLVGSTAMAGRVGPAAAEGLRLEHFGLLREPLERTGGREVKNLGDGLIEPRQRARWSWFRSQRSKSGSWSFANATCRARVGVLRSLVGNTYLLR